MSLAGTTVLITGASRGLGEALAERFVAEGANVAMCARNEGPLTEVAVRLRANRRDPGQQIVAEAADVSEPDQVDRLVEVVLERFGGLDVLVCNAGVYGPIGPFEELDWDDWVDAVKVNLFGTVLPCRAVVPTMRRQEHGKIVVLSGGGATQALPRFSAYAASKAAVVRFVETLARELDGTGIDVNAVAPGPLNTRFLDQALGAGPELTGEDFYARAVRQREAGGTPMSIASDLVAFLASEASDGISGRLIAALWDDWRSLPQLRERLAGSDVYTLRRIIPEERDWPKA